MSMLINRRGAAVLAAGAALLLATLVSLAGPPRAEAATIYACVKKKSGNIRIVSRTAKCKKGESKLTWNTQGAAGRNGANGINGATGPQGKEGGAGKEGKLGAPGSALAYAHVNSDGTIDAANTSSNITNANITHASEANYEFSGLPFTIHSVTVTLGFGVALNDDAYAAVLGPTAAGVAIYSGAAKEKNDNFYIVFN